MKKFEYKIEPWSNVNMNALGSEGWEFCHMIQTGECIFKREIQEVKTLDQTPTVGKRVSYGSEDCPFDTGIIEKIEGYKVWVRWSDGKYLYIWTSDFENGRARIIE